jgi:hypothetical protein
MNVAHHRQRGIYRHRIASLEKVRRSTPESEAREIKSNPFDAIRRPGARVVLLVNNSQRSREESVSWGLSS